MAGLVLLSVATVKPVATLTPVVTASFVKPVVKYSISKI